MLYIKWYNIYRSKTIKEFNTSLFPIVVQVAAISIVLVIIYSKIGVTSYVLCSLLEQIASGVSFPLKTCFDEFNRKTNGIFPWADMIAYFSVTFKVITKHSFWEWDNSTADPMQLFRSMCIIWNMFSKSTLQLRAETLDFLLNLNCKLI